jgi:hypothetical protein
MKALSELTGALYEEVGNGDVTLVLPAKTYNTVVPQPHDTSGLTEYVIFAQGGKVRFRFNGREH